MSATDMPVPLSTDLTKTNGQWRGLIGAIPAGLNRTFTAKAFGADGTQLFEGQAAGVTITAGQTTVVAVTLNPLNTGPLPGNVAPIIDSLVASANTVQPGGTLSLIATAHDPNPEDLLTYAWTATAGTFGAPAGPSITWTAPSFTGMVTLRLTVTDQSGATTEAELTLLVQHGTGNADVILRLNTWPHISSLSAAPSPVAVGATTLLQGTAGDSDGDLLSYQWQATGCTGSWQGTTTAQASFTPDALPAGGACTCVISLTVSDGNGGQLTRSLSLCVQSTTDIPQPPVITSVFQSATTVPGGASVLLRVLGSNAQGGSLNFTWTANTGTLGAPTNGPNQSELTWTAPACVPFNTTPTIQVTLGNAQGLTTNYTFTVNGILACGPNGPRSSPWSFLGGLAAALESPMAEPVSANRVLIVQGTHAELYDLSSDTSTITRGPASPGSTLTSLPGGKVLNIGSGIPEIYDPSTETWSRTAPRNHSTSGHTATRLSSGKILVAGGFAGGTPTSVAEIYDPANNVWTTIRAMTGRRSSHTATLLPSNKVLVAGGMDSNSSNSLGTSEIYDPTTGFWLPTGSLITPRANHKAVLLDSGEGVLVTGGTYNGTEVATAEIYNPLTEEWTPAGNMSSPRAMHAAVNLGSGKILVAGGINQNREQNTVDIYDESARTWTTAESMKGKRSNLSATLLSSSKIFVVGGEGELEGTSMSAAATVEVYDPVTKHWNSTSFINRSFSSWHETALLPSSGKILVPHDSYSNQGLATFDPVTKQWALIANSGKWARTTVAQLQPSGNLLLVSDDQWGVFSLQTETLSYSSNRYSYSPLATPLNNNAALLLQATTLPETYDLLSNTWTQTDPIGTSRYSPSATTLRSNKVLVAGGYTANGPIASAEIFDPATNRWRPTGSMATPHNGHVAVRLNSGHVLVAGGNSARTVELYDPDREEWTSLPPYPASVTPSGGVLLPSGKVLVFGYGGAHLFDPATPDTWTSTGATVLNGSRSAHPLRPDSDEVLVMRYDFNAWLVPALYTP